MDLFSPSDANTRNVISSLGGDFSAGGIATASTNMPAGSSVGGGSRAVGGLGSLFSGGGLSTLLAAGGSLAGLSLIGSQNPLARGIGGAGLGLGIGSLAGPLISSLATSAFLGGSIGSGLASGLMTIGNLAPIIGPIIGGIIALSTLLGPKHQQDRHALEMSELDDIAKVMSAYQGNQADYRSAVNTLEKLREQGEQQFAQWGTQNHTAEQVDSHINLAESQLASMEAGRQAQQQAILAEQQRRQGLSFSPGLFSAGGMVGSYAGSVPAWFSAVAQRYGSGGDVVPAMLTPGERVLTREEARQYNGGVPVQITLQAWDGPSVQRWLDNGGDKQIAASIIKLRYQGIRVA